MEAYVSACQARFPDFAEMARAGAAWRVRNEKDLQASEAALVALARKEFASERERSAKLAEVRADLKRRIESARQAASSQPTAEFEAECRRVVRFLDDRALDLRKAHRVELDVVTRELAKK